MINGIVCVSKNWGIGKVNKVTGKGQLLFNIPEDMKFFREKTKFSIVVFGETTYLSLNVRPLKNRVNIVLCPEYSEYPDAICIHDFDQLVEFVKILAKEYEVYICGGGMLYKSFLPYYDRVYVTKVDAVDDKATVFFPNLDEDPNFEPYPETRVAESNGYNIEFITYNRVGD